MKKKLQALLVAASMMLSMLPMLPNAAMAADVTEVSLPDISGINITAGGQWAKQSEATLKYKGAVKNFTDSTYLCTPYKEIKIFNSNETTDDGPLGDYDKIEFYVGLASDSSATDGAQLVISKWVDGGGTVKKDWTASAVTLTPGAQAQKITIDLQGYDSAQINVGDVKAEESDGQAIKVIFGDLKAYKSDREYDRFSSVNSTVSGYFGGMTQNVKGSASVPVTSGAPYYIEYKRLLDGSQYSAMEFYLGTASYTPVDGVDQYARVRIMTTSDTSYKTNSGVYTEYYIKVGTDPRFISLPIPSTTQGLKMILHHGYFNSDGSFVQFSTDSNFGVANGSLKLGLFDFKLYKNKNVYVAKGFNGTQTMTTIPGNVKDNWNNLEFYVGDKKSDAFMYSDGKYWTQDMCWSRNNDTKQGTTTLTFVTEGYVDRFTGTFGVAAGQSAVATATDYIIVKGYNWANPAAKNVNNKVAGTEGTVLYSTYAMPDGFNEAFDIDTSGYDYIKIFNYFATEPDGTVNWNRTRRASLMDFAFHQYNVSAINSSFDKATGVIISTSKQTRSAGTMAAVAYSNEQPTGVAFNNAATMGTETVSVTGYNTQNATAIARNTLDCSSMLDGTEYIKYYYLDGTALESLTIDDLSALTEESLVDTYVISYNISSIKACENIVAVQGTDLVNITLPETVTVVAGGKEFSGIGVTWDTSSYKKDTVGEYTFTGTLNADDLTANELINSNSLTASVTVKVKAPVVSNENSTYSDVKIGGGGFVTGIAVHPKNQNIVYARTDVGGAYRYDATTDKWTCITDWLPHFNLYGIDAIAVDPSDENVVYICAGTYWYNAGHGIYKSTDKGNTWENISFTSDSRVFSGNSINRTAGDSLAIDPNNSDIIYCGTRVDGLWVTTDGGENWTKTTLPVTELDKNSACTGIRTVAIKDNGDTSTVYAGVYDYSDIEGGVYVSNDNGTTWEIVSGGPAYPLNMEIAEDGNLYVSSGNAMSVSENTPSSFMKYDGTAWTDLTPDGYQAAGSFDTYMDNDNLVIYLAESNKSATVYKKTGDGAWETALTWDNVKEAYKTANWFTDHHSALLGQHSYVGDLEISENNGKVEMWISDGGVGIWHNKDIASDLTAFEASVDGVEVTSLLSLAVASDSNGKYKLISSNADFGIVATSDITDETKAVNIKTIGNSEYFGKVTDVAICPDNSNYMAFATSYDGVMTVVTSTDGGATWTKASELDSITPDYEAKLAIGAANGGVPAIVVLPDSTDGENNVQYSTDFGKTWELSYLDSEEFVTTAYNVNYNNITASGNSFYIYDFANYTVYSSNDNGENFTANVIPGLAADTSSIGEKLKNSYYPTIVAKPGAENEVWVSNWNGLYKSVDSGATFTEVSSEATINNVRSFSFGKGLTDGTPSVFVLGNIEGVYGLYRSDNNGEAWVKLNDSSVSYSVPTREIAGDMETYGRVYIATGGRGIMMLDKAVEAPEKSVEITKTETGYQAAISNYTGNAVIVAASYESTGALKSVAIGESKTIDGNGTLNVTFADAENVKIFIWESLQTGTPVFPAQVK